MIVLEIYTEMLSSPRFLETAQMQFFADEEEDKAHKLQWEIEGYLNMNGIRAHVFLKHIECLNKNDNKNEKN